jgi:hypothetical protein
MNKEFCTYEQALALKELGFDEPCFGYWKSKNWLIQEKPRTDGYTHADQECSAPLYQQAFSWFRTKNIDSAIFEKHKDLGKFYGGYTKQESDNFGKSFGSNFKTYEEAESACLDKLLEIMKNK